MEITNKESNYQIAKSVSSNFISGLSGNMMSYGLGLMLLDQTKSPISFGIEMMIAPIVGVLFLVPIGNWVDKERHKKILTIAYLARILFLIILLLTIDHFHGGYKLIPVVPFVFLNSLCTNISGTAYASSVHELVNSEKIPQLSSFTSAATSLANILSPALGVALYAFAGFDIFIDFEIASAVLSFLIMLTMKFHYEPVAKIAEPKPAQSEHSQFTKFKEGLHYISKRDLIKRTILIGVFMNFAFSATNIGLPYIIKEQLHAGNSPVGTLDTATAIGMLLGSLSINLLPKKKTMYQKIMPGMLFASTAIALMGILFVRTNQPLTINIIGGIISFILGIAISIINVVAQIRMQSTIPTKILGRVMSTTVTANTAVMPIGILFFTFVFDNIKPGAYILIADGIFCLLAVLLQAKGLKKAVHTDDEMLAKQDAAPKTKQN